MSRAGTVWLIVAIVLVAVAAIVFLVGMSAAGWDFRYFGTGAYEMRTHATDAPFQGVSLETDAVVILPATDGVAKVVAPEGDNFGYAVSVEDGVLTVKKSDSRSWILRVFDFGEREPVQVYLPAGEYGALAVRARTGDVSIGGGLTFASLTVDATTADIALSANVTGDAVLSLTTGDVAVRGCTLASLSVSVTTGDIAADSLTVTGDVLLKTDTGDVEMVAVRCASLTLDGTTGDAALSDVIAEGTMTVERTTGDILLSGADAAEMTIKSTTGDVRGTILTDKVFFAHTTTGDVRVPEGTTGGACRVNTTTGDILLSIGRGDG